MGSFLSDRTNFSRFQDHCFFWGGRFKNSLDSLNSNPGKPRKVPFFGQLWLVLGVNLMEINSNWFSRMKLFSLLTFW